MNRRTLATGAAESILAAGFVSRDRAEQFGETP